MVSLINILLNILFITVSIRRKSIYRAEHVYWEFSRRDKTATGVNLSKNYLFTSI